MWRNDTQRLWSLSKRPDWKVLQKFRYPARSNRLRKVKSLQLGAAEIRHHRGFQFILDAFGNYLHPERAAKPDNGLDDSF